MKIKMLPIAMLLAAHGAHGQDLDFAHLIPNASRPNIVNYSLADPTLPDSKNSGIYKKGLAAFPIYSTQWQNGSFVNVLSGLGYNFSKDPRIQFGLRMTIEGTPDEPKNFRLRLPGTVPNPVLESGAYLNYYVNPNYSLLSSIKYGAGVDHNGLQISVGAQASTQIAQKHRLTARLSANWANGSYLQAYLGTNSLQASSSSIGNLLSNSSLSDVRLGANWQWNIDTNWSLTTGASIKHVISDSNNPLNFQRNPVTVYSAASFRF